MVQATVQRKKLAIVGTGISHALAPVIHNFIAEAIDLPYDFGRVDTPDIKSFVSDFRSPDWVGAVITLPHKIAVIPLLDESDQHVKALRACNGLWKRGDGTVVGTNTDWRGIYGSLINASAEGRGKPALIIGAGGASRAAAYALSANLDCPVIYVINRDSGEVDALLADITEGYTSAGIKVPQVIHLTSSDQLATLPSPFYIVGTVPDFEPQTETELLARKLLVDVLERKEKGVLLDMCYKPRETRHIKLGEQYGWKTADGVNIIAYQFEEQWTMWAGKDNAMRIPVKEARAELYRAAC